jgi:hypothetical protein
MQKYKYHKRGCGTNSKNMGEHNVANLSINILAGYILKFNQSITKSHTEPLYLFKSTISPSQSKSHNPSSFQSHTSQPFWVAGSYTHSILFTLLSSLHIKGLIRKCNMDTIHQKRCSSHMRIIIKQFTYEIHQYKFISRQTVSCVHSFY